MSALARQPDLFFSGDYLDPACGAELLAPRLPGQRTGDRVDDDRRAGALSAYAEGCGVRHICRMFSISHHTLKALIDRDLTIVATEKKRVSSEIGHIQRLMLDRLRCEIQDMRLDVIPLAFGILSDKKALIDGDPTSRIEHTAGPSLDDLRASLAGVVDAEIVSTGDAASSEIIVHCATNAVEIARQSTSASQSAG